MLDLAANKLSSNKHGMSPEKILQSRETKVAAKFLDEISFADRQLGISCLVVRSI
jgi:hypothetical protein